MTKIIHKAIAAPGAGKTQTLINTLPEYIKRGEKIILALPTLKLSDDIVQRMHQAGLMPKIVNSEQCAKESVTKALGKLLWSGCENLIISTHEGIQLADPKLLRGYILVIDEVPEVLELNHYTLSEPEAQRIIDNTTSHGRHLKIKNGQITAIKNRVYTYKAALTNQKLGSTLSPLESKVYTTILNGNLAYMNKVKPQDGSESKYNIHTVVEKNLFEHIENAKETHILAANIDGGLFDLFAKKRGYEYKKSQLTPCEFNYTCNIHIYPLIKGRWSKTKALEDSAGNSHQSHIGLYNHQNIDKALAAAMWDCPLKKPLIFLNSWHNFDLNHDYPKSDAKVCQIDSRGLNNYMDSTAAILLFGGLPSPHDRESLKRIGEQHGIDLKSLIDAWLVKNKLEASLQAATRTAIRNPENTTPVSLYVQDSEVAAYLKNTYMRNAVIDDRLALTPAEKEDGRSNLTAHQKAEIKDFIQKIARMRVKRSAVNKHIMVTWGASETTARRWTKDFFCKPHTWSTENLEKFLV
ncbi:hypothetical protein [Pseudomonas sp. MS19]|uniref:hypothetical protein n=1 Tax=Pseudomonas sp. MS19 TaxID=2579939 RepID=UPI001562D2DE|nr:hypothetical protein [Pseudomonas sp. MS19]NRH29222.1 hypothetical protein [Pseudomonas sp. MS19]